MSTEKPFAEYRDGRLIVGGITVCVDMDGLPGAFQRDDSGGPIHVQTFTTNTTEG